MTSCNRNKDVAENVDALPEIYPDYRGVTVPWNIAPLNFCMTDDEYSSMEVRVKGSLKGEMICEGDYADFDIDEWHRLLNDNKGGKSKCLCFCTEEWQVDDIPSIRYIYQRYSNQRMGNNLSIGGPGI